MMGTTSLQPFVQALGWALLHALWQGALVMILLACALHFMRGFSAHARYVAATLGLLLMLAAPTATFSRLYISAPAAGSEASQSAANVDNGRAANMKGNVPKGATHAQPDSAGGVLKPVDFASLQSLTESRFPSLARWLVLFWLAGIVIFSGRLFSGWMATERLKRRGIERATAACEESFARLARRIGISRPARLYKSVLVEVPTVIGWLRPVILVPVSAFTGLSQQQLEALLAHELAHVRRYDYLVNLLQAIAETLLFYHPAVWWVSKQIRVEREHACDDLAVEACGDALLYARALAELETLRVGDERSLALAANGGSLLSRIRRLISAPARDEQRRHAWLPALLLFVTISSTLAVAQGALFAVTDAEGIRPSASSPKRAVAFTFVGLPYYRGGDETVESLNDTTNKLLAGMAANNIKAVGFVGENQLYREGQTEERINLLRRWLDAGHELGNQSYKHMSLYNTPLEIYEANVLRGEQVTRSLMQERGRQLKYFSYPYLNTGPNAETKKAFEQFLKEHGYRIHAVTIDNLDWIFSNAYLEARNRGDREVMKRISDEYVVYMESVFAHYEQLSTKVFGREIPQVLMLSASALNADNFDRLVEMLKRRGYAFITMDEALEDKAFAQQPAYAGPWGISWIERWAIEKGVDLRGDPVLPRYMWQFGKDGLKTPNKSQ
ncbi:MAG: polysaccharide deacetylase family protein [Pyrinomonadaceae bacterium]|nr:polysaccharide deacetylase family protein [Pyrinomonadaceae bacterium]